MGFWQDVVSLFGGGGKDDDSSGARSIDEALNQAQQRELVGFNVIRDPEEVRRENFTSFAAPVRDDGAVHVEPVGGSFAAYVDLDGSVRTETELITRYRNMSLQTEIDSALNEIVGDAIITGQDEQEIVELNLEDLKDDVSDQVKEKLDDTFDDILRMLDFNNKGYSIFRKWFVDGRLYYYAIIDAKDPKAGILELRYVDPRKIRKIREIQRVLDPSRTFEMIKTVNEYYLYNDQGFGIQKGVLGVPQETKGLKIARDSVMLATSGVTDESGRMVLSYLHKAIKPMNQLRAVEDASVIYRLVRAPERRVFYIDVGDLPKQKADQYMRDIMTKHTNRVVYDAQTGNVRDDRKFMTTVEDYWLPRRNGESTTQIDTLKGGDNLGKMEDVEYFLKRLYRSLNVPLGRLDSENMSGLDIKATGITREEVSFGRFIDRLRAEFSNLFLQMLERQLMLREVITPADWSRWGSKIKFKWARDNLYAEGKDQEVLLERIQVANQLSPYVGIHFSHQWMRRYVWRQSDEDIREIDEEIKRELRDPRYAGKYLPGVQPPEAEPGMEPPMPDEGSDFAGEDAPQGYDVPPAREPAGPPESTMRPKTGRLRG